jgi:hypothetical protein
MLRMLQTQVLGAVHHEIWAKIQVLGWSFEIARRSEFLAWFWSNRFENHSKLILSMVFNFLDGFHTQNAANKKLEAVRLEILGKCSFWTGYWKITRQTKFLAWFWSNRIENHFKLIFGTPLNFLDGWSVHMHIWGVHMARTRKKWMCIWPPPPFFGDFGAPYSGTTMTFQTFLLQRGIGNDRKVSRMHSSMKGDCTVLGLYRGPWKNAQNPRGHSGPPFFWDFERPGWGPRSDRLT